jgi:hypothetical protein
MPPKSKKGKKGGKKEPIKRGAVGYENPDLDKIEEFPVEGLAKHIGLENCSYRHGGKDSGAYSVMNHLYMTCENGPLNHEMGCMSDLPAYASLPRSKTGSLDLPLLQLQQREY